MFISRCFELIPLRRALARRARYWCEKTALLFVPMRPFLQQRHPQSRELFFGLARPTKMVTYFCSFRAWRPSRPEQPRKCIWGLTLEHYIVWQTLETLKTETLVSLKTINSLVSLKSEPLITLKTLVSKTLVSLIPLQYTTIFSAY